MFSEGSEKGPRRGQSRRGEIRLRLNDRFESSLTDLGRSPTTIDVERKPLPLEEIEDLHDGRLRATVGQCPLDLVSREGTPAARAIDFDIDLSIPIAEAVTSLPV